MQPHAEQGGRLELRINQFDGDAGRETVLVVEGRGAAVFDQVRHADERGVEERLGRQAREHRVDAPDPVEYVGGPHQAGTVAHQRLEEVVVRVHQAGIDHQVAGIDHGGVGRRLQSGADGRNPSVADQKIHIPQHRRDTGIPHQRSDSAQQQAHASSCISR